MTSTTTDNQQKIKTLTEKHQEQLTTIDNIKKEIDTATIKNKNTKQQLDNLLSTTADNQQKIKTLTEQHQEQLTTIDNIKRKSIPQLSRIKILNNN